MNKIINYWNEDYVLSSADMIAVKAGIKKTTRIECASRNDFKEIKKSLEKHKLNYVFSDKKVFGQYNVYISLSKKLALQAKRVDPTFKIFLDKLSFNDSIDFVRLYSELISYPNCCVNNYIDNVLKQRKIQEIKVIKEIPVKINFYLNNILNGFSNYYISFHLPCSFLCKKNLKYQKDIYEAIKVENLVFAKKLKKTLEHPFLLFFEKNQDSAYATWDCRQGFILNGLVRGNEIKYEQYYFLKTVYPDYEDEKKNQQEINNIINSIETGNKIIVDKQILLVYKKDLLIKKIKSKNFSFHIFNFA